MRLAAHEAGLQRTILPGSRPDFSAAALDDLIRHPHFDQALVTSARCTVEQWQASWTLNRVMSDRGRAVAVLMTLDLYYAAADRAGLALVQLREEAARHGFASAGRITAWVATMRVLGFLAVHVPGRPQRVVPTTKFLAMLRDGLERNWRSLAQLHPHGQQAIERLEDDTFLRHVVRGFIGPYRNGQRVLDAVPELAAIADREAAICILFSMLLRDACGEPISIARLAREFFVSRAHVRSLLRAMEAMGLLSRSHAAGGYRPGPGFRPCVSRLMAALFQAHIFATDRALVLCGALEADSAAAYHSVPDTSPATEHGGTANPWPVP